jgi:glycerol-3-phosphate dehydrogenase
MNITILGCGAFGHAMTSYLDSYTQNTIKIWDIRQEIIDHIANNGHHPEYPQVSFSKRIIPTFDLQTSFENADYIVLAISARGLTSFLHAQNSLPDNIPFINTAKALASDGRFFSEHFADCGLRYGMLAGAMKAETLRDGDFTCLTLAGEDSLSQLQKDMTSDHMSVFYSANVATTEMAAILKNIFTLLYGYLDGQGVSLTEREYILTRIRSHLLERYPHLGDRSLLPIWEVDVRMSLHGTRNVQFGYDKGQNPQKTPDHTVEGWHTLQNLPQNPVLYTPEIQAVYDYIVGGGTYQEFFHQI